MLTEMKTFYNGKLEEHFFVDNNSERQGLYKCY